jgi:predicted MFS family arabinose efflux permease
LFNSVTFGLGAIVGALLGGYLYENFGMSVLFQGLTLLAVIALIVFWFASRTPKDMSLSPSES